MNLEWFLIRGSGLAAFALLAGATVWGLLISTKILGRAARAKSVTWFHESLAIGAVVATIVHMIALGVHDFIDFSWSDILVPGASNWQPLSVALGVIGFYLLVVITASFYVKKLIGQQAWKAIHYLSFGLYLAALLHGITAGTDRGHAMVVWSYSAATAATVVLTIIKLTQVRDGSGAAGRPGRIGARPAPAPDRQVPPARAGTQNSPSMGSGFHGPAEDRTRPATEART